MSPGAEPANAVERDLGAGWTSDRELPGGGPPPAPTAIDVMGAHARDQLVALIEITGAFGELGARVEGIGEQRPDVAAHRIFGQRGLEPAAGVAVRASRSSARSERDLPAALAFVERADVEAG